jgi:peroxiredoxin Q/BCP
MNNPIQVGDICPSFTLPNQSGELIQIDEFIGKKKLVLFFYPKDDTPGCTKEACEFRDRYTEFLDKDCVVFGISSDSETAHVSFQNKYQLPYSLLSDQAKKVRKLFGVPGNLFGLIPGRVTYIFNLKGVCIGIFNSQLDPIGHIDAALKLLHEDQS